ncbi:MAG: hypothetical protein ABEJ23_07260 [Haloarculaceae archaeon]
MEVLTTDLDELEASLQQALDRIGDFRAGTRVDSDAFFAEPFMRAHTDYETFDAFREDAPVELDVPVEDPATRGQVDDFVADATEFETWEEMQTTAAQEEVVDQLLSNTA